MRALPVLLAVLAAPACAQDLAETHFSMNFCWERTYSAEHLAEHPEQRVTRVVIRKEPLGFPKSPGETLMEIAVTFRGADGSREGPKAEAIGFCRADGGERLSCGLEGDAGRYEMVAEGRELLLTVGEEGMVFESSRARHELRADEGDDRSFLLRRCG